MSTLLQVNDITKIYQTQPKPGLDHVSFDVMQGEFLGIMGASGSGKTTLLNVLSTIDVPTSGNINMGKVKIQELNQRQAADFRKDNLGFIFQEYFLLDSLTVQENIAVPLTLLHKSAKEIDKKSNGACRAIRNCFTTEKNTPVSYPVVSASVLPLLVQW